MYINRDKRQSTFSITCFENLSNEIYYEIFDYLDGGHIYKTFSNLNIRFQQLINSSSFLLKISLYYNSKSKLKHYCRDVIIPNKHRIISLHISNSIHIDKFFTYCIVDETFNRLESIKLANLTICDLMPILFYFKSLPRLLVLIVTLRQFNSSSTHLDVIYQITSSLPFLKYNSLSCKEYELYTLVPLSTNQQFSTIEYLTMKYSCTLKELILILKHTPRLHHLTCEKLSESYDNFEDEVSTMLSNLTYVSIWYCCIKFEKFEKFIKKICSQLKVSHIWKFLDENYVAPDRWKQLILQNMSQLHRFDLKCYTVTDNNFTDIHSDSFVRQLTSQFWIERGWMIGLEIQPEKIFYSINSKRKTGFSFDKNVEISTYSNQNIGWNSTQYRVNSIPIHMSITNYPAVEFSIPFINKFSSILLAIQFTCLHISFSNLLISTLVKIIGLLSNLDSLKVSFSSLEQLSDLSIEDAENLRLVSISNKITRVWLPMEFNLMYVLIKLCPRMEHLEVDHVNEEDLTKVVRIILMKSCTHICHLYSICFHIYTENDEIIYDLEKIIDSEKLLLDYKIKRKCNDILLQWKLQ